MAMVRHDYFRQIDRPIQAYILGLLASDGCVYSDRPRVKFSVHEKDRVLTETVRDELAPGSPILMERCRDYKLAKVHFTSPEMCKDLAKLGIVPKKSHILTWPTLLPEAFVNSFLLGILDGDGCLMTDKRKLSPHYIISITSASPAFLEQTAHKINAVLDVPLAHIDKNNTAFAIRYGGKSAALISEWLHRDLAGLDRKRIPPEVFSLYTTYVPYIPR